MIPIIRPGLFRCATRSPPSEVLKERSPSSSRLLKKRSSAKKASATRRNCCISKQKCARLGRKRIEINLRRLFEYEVFKYKLSERLNRRNLSLEQAWGKWLKLHQGSFEQVLIKSLFTSA